MNRVAPQFSIALLILLLAGCSSSPSPQDFNELDSAKNISSYEKGVQQEFLEVYNDWKGVPYRLGGNTYSGIDCSAFVQVAYREALNIQLPRTTLAQVSVGNELSYEQVQVGDLAFFKTSRKVRHVGVYIGNKQFMHASTSKGVMISRLDNPYWASKFWHFRRVATPPAVN